MARLELDAVSKRYGGDVLAVDGVTLDVPDGGFAVLVGPSGCGKSTTLRMIAGLESVDEGEIRIAGRRVNEVPPQRRDVAVVFQNYALYPHMTVARNMGFGLRMRKVARDEIRERIDTASRVLGIAHLLGRYPAQLSGGERQRVAVGRAIVRDPSVFLFDEPLSNLDAQLRAEMRVELMRIQQRVAGTFVFVTHDQVEAMTLADVLAVMEHGRIQQQGTPEEIYRRPANRFVAGFIGSPKMNFLEGRIERTRLGYVLMRNHTHLPMPDDPRLGPLHGRQIVLGIRPEHLRLDPEGSIEIEVEVVEALGSQTFVYGTIAPEMTMTVALDPAEHPERGTHLTLSFDSADMHAFDAESGVSFGPARSSARLA